MVKRMTLLLGLLSLAFCQIESQRIPQLQHERWIYRYNGTGNNWDEVRSIVYGPDGSIYAAGFSSVGGTDYEFTVISLTTTGAERWIYSNNPGSSLDQFHSIVYGLDDNLYVAGHSVVDSTYGDFIVISLTTTGAERWVYRYNGPSNYYDEAYTLTYGVDSNIYAAGYSENRLSESDFLVISLTTDGNERWVYRYSGSGRSGLEEAHSIVYADGNIYAAGLSVGKDTSMDFTVISLDTTGNERWVYQFNGPANDWDAAFAIVNGPDGNIYAAGSSTDWYGGGMDFTVISLTQEGAERWVYRYNGTGNVDDFAFSLIYGADNNIYTAGYSWGAGVFEDIVTISLTPTGAERWVYRYNGPGDNLDWANTVVYGLDGNVYTAGYSWGIGTNYDFTVISLTTDGNERWLYRYNGPGNDWDEAKTMVYGADGNIYVAGNSCGNNMWPDFIVISLNPEPGIEEQNNQARNNKFSLLTATIYNQNLTYSLSVPTLSTISLSLYNLSGQKILSWQNSSPKGTSHYTKNLPSISSGIYFLRAEVLDKGYKANKKLIVTKKLQSHSL